MATLSSVKALAQQLLAEISALEASQREEVLPQPEPSLPPPTPAPSRLAWGRKVSPTFRDRVRWIAQELHLDPNWLMACMAFETGRTFSASVKNPGSSATGLIQFMAATAQALGTSTDELRRMTAEDQLNYVYKYFRDRIRERGPITNLGDCYMAILNPAGMGKPDDYVMWVERDKAYAVNAGLDRNKDRKITKAEACAHVYALLDEGLQPENLG